MNAVGVLLRKDLGLFFRRPLFYMIAGLCALIWSPLYIYAFGEFLSQLVSAMGPAVEYMSYQQRVVVEFISLVNFILLLFLNGITMKLITEEKKNRTFDLLMTSPLHSWQIVLAKFLAGYIVALVLITISFLYPLTTAYFGSVNWVPLMSSYLGLMLFAAVYVSIGLFASAMTQSVLVAFLLALIFNLFLWFAGVGEYVSVSWMASVFEYINFEPIFKDFNTGVIRLSAVVYLVSLSLMACVGAERLIETSRWR